VGSYNPELSGLQPEPAHLSRGKVILHHLKLFIGVGYIFLMDPVKEAFEKVKEDISSLKKEIAELRQNMLQLCDIMQKFAQKEGKKDEIFVPVVPAYQVQNPASPQESSTHNLPFKALNPQKQPFSTGNGGVPADRQTNQQTDRHIENPIENAAEMLESLNNLKKEIKDRFRKLTEQEWVVFSAIYQLDEEAGYSDYKALAARLNLTESSIRDYVSRLIIKGIPVDKIRLNNKNIRLNISESLKRIAPLPAILQLRDV
jgi:DNA-binding MarR family transcriptional regulator